MTEALISWRGIHMIHALRFAFMLMNLTKIPKERLICKTENHLRSYFWGEDVSDLSNWIICDRTVLLTPSAPTNKSYLTSTDSGFGEKKSFELSLKEATLVVVSTDLSSYSK